MLAVNIFHGMVLYKSRLNGIPEFDLLCSSDMFLKSIKSTWLRKSNLVEEIGLTTRDLTDFLALQK